MANRAGGDLLDGRPAALKSHRVVLRCQVADERCYTILFAQQQERLLQQRRLSRAGAGDQADHAEAGLMKALTKSAGKQIVLLQDPFPHFYDSRLRGHAISKATISSSVPSAS